MTDPELEMRVAKLERMVADLYKRMNLNEPVYTSNEMHGDAEVIEALRGGNMIQAIKTYREKTGTSLAEAKRAVEEIAARYGPFR